MKKQLIILSAFAILLGGCGSQSAAGVKHSKITLTDEEMKEVGNNPNAGAQLLVRKAVLKEMAQVKYSEDEKKELEEIKKNVELEYFLNKKGIENTKVDDMEVLQVYQNNMDKLKEADIVEVLPQIKEQMIYQRREEEKIKYMNSLVDKYDLNAEFRRRFPEIEKPIETVSQTNEADKADENDNEKETKSAVENKK